MTHTPEAIADQRAKVARLAAKVDALRAAGGTPFDAAITARNDAQLTLTFMERAAADEAPGLKATIYQGYYGMWFVTLTGNGYPIDHLLPSPLIAETVLSAAVEDGFRIVDSRHYCDVYGVLAGQASQYEDSRDAAEGPAVAFVGSVPGDDAGVDVLVDEIEF